jgi:hypothetical protein
MTTRSLLGRAARIWAVLWCASAAQAAPPAAEEARAPSSERAYAVSEERASCAAHDPLRAPFFGDTHVHTGYSQDASTQGTRTTPRDAYRFARGHAIAIQPFRDDGSSLRSVRLARPLDFAVVTDHAEQIGEVHVCKTPGAPGHDSLVCLLYRNWPRAAFFVMNAAYSSGGERFDFCGEGGAGCLAAAQHVWRDTQAAAAEAYDRSAACRFTSFVGYEWTSGVDNGKNLHRNVIFRNERVPALPISTMETGPNAAQLWQALDRECVRGTPGCEVLTIPHNSNLDGGLMFQSARELGGEIDASEAALRTRWEPLVEVMQHKGDSECLLGGDTTDEACGFEKLPYDNFGGRWALVGAEAPKRVQYVREALKRGLALDERLGANPFRYGIVASTDTHLGTPGLTSESAFPGHGGAGGTTSGALPPGLPDVLEYGPGGLAVLWAEENSRDALFAAMQRREAYGTSGTRPVVRFFGGAALPTELCSDPAFVAKGYAHGVAMGGELRAASGSAAPRFALLALKDAGAHGDPASDLERAQIVKGWLDAKGALHERVVDVAGGATGASVDTRTCRQSGRGHARLCGVWQDPDFDPRERAFYYARVLEAPSCRWSQHLCVAKGVDCTRPETIGEGLEGCCAPEHRPVVQERAWTSPIWVSPE